jgi:hypothetical protein
LCLAGGGSDPERDSSTEQRIFTENGPKKVPWPRAYNLTCAAEQTTGSRVTAFDSLEKVEHASLLRL